MSAFTRVAAVAHDGMAMFSLGMVDEIFGFDRRHRGMPGFELLVCATRPGPIRTDTGLTVQVPHGLDRIAEADLVIPLSWTNFDNAPEPELLDALRTAYDQGAIIASQCTGAFLLCSTGLLNGKRAATHWRYVAELARRFPEVTFDPNVLYVDEGRLLSSSGSAAGMDMCFYLLRREFGAGVAAAIARDLVMPPHREGGQAQYIPAAMPACDGDGLTELLTWAQSRLDQPLTVNSLAHQVAMSPRSFARRFKETTGTTPKSWLSAQRLLRAEELLEQTDLSVEEIARQTGFGSAAALREQFVRRRGVPPRDYRRTFQS